MTNTVLIREFPSGSISLNKDEVASEGKFQPLSRDEDLRDGVQEVFYINGLPRLKASVNKIQFWSVDQNS